MSAIGKNRSLRRSLIVESEGQETETYWIYLKPGFHNGSGEHAIAEDTKREARSRLSDVKACECVSCLLLVHEKAAAASVAP